MDFVSIFQVLTASEPKEYWVSSIYKKQRQAVWQNWNLYGKNYANGVEVMENGHPEDIYITEKVFATIIVKFDS